MNAQVRAYTDLELKGALVLGVDNTEFPNPARLGQFVLKDGVLFGYQNIGGFATWYPLTQTSKSYLHTQGLDALEWVVQHNLGVDDQWFQVLDNTGNMLFCSRSEVTANSFKLTFTEACTGTCLVVVPDEINVPSAQVVALTAGTISVANDTVQVSADGIQVSGSKVLTVADLGSGTLFVTQAQMDERIHQVVGTAPAALDTLEEVASRIQAGETVSDSLVGAIALKANSADLAAVAFSGSYLDLTNVPSPNPASTVNITTWTGTPYDIAFPVFSKPTASEQVFRFVAARAYKMPALQTDGQAKAAVAATAAATFVLTKNGVQFGTVKFAAGATTGTINIAADTAFAIGDRLTVTAPATVDSTLADLDFTFITALA